MEACNAVSARFGLVLSSEQMQRLSAKRFEALGATGRIEFGGGVLHTIITEFCDSPYITQDNYEETLEALQEAFYYFKNESMESLSDEELIQAMKQSFDTVCQGSLEYLVGTDLETLCRSVRFGDTQEEDWDEE